MGLHAVCYTQWCVKHHYTCTTRRPEPGSESQPGAGNSGISVHAVKLANRDFYNPRLISSGVKWGTEGWATCCSDAFRISFFFLVKWNNVCLNSRPAALPLLHFDCTLRKWPGREGGDPCISTGHFLFLWLRRHSHKLVFVAVFEIYIQILRYLWESRGGSPGLQKWNRLKETDSHVCAVVMATDLSCQ